MKYCLAIPARDYTQLLDCLTVTPYIGRVVFCLTEKQLEDGCCHLKIASIIPPGPGDYLWQSEDGFAFSQVFLINILRRANAENRSLLYIHTHRAGADTDCRANGDEKMLFRIAYGICPLGVHASLVLKSRTLYGNVWLPGLETAPLIVIPSRFRPVARPQNTAAITEKAR